MRCLTAILFVAALRTVVNAAPPVDLREVAHPADQPAIVNDQVSDAILGTRGDNAAGDDVDLKTIIAMEAPALSPRANVPPSLSAIFSNLINEIQPSADKLRYLTPDNATLSIITDALASTNMSLANAIPQVQALEGLNTGAIFASLDGQTMLTPSELATTAEQCFSLISNAVDAALNLWSIQGNLTVRAVCAPLNIGSALKNVGKGVGALLSNTISSASGLDAIPVLGALADAFGLVGNLLNDLVVRTPTHC